MEQQQRKENHGGVIRMPPFYDSLSILHSDTSVRLNYFGLWISVVSWC